MSSELTFKLKCSSCHHGDTTETFSDDDRAKRLESGKQGKMTRVCSRNVDKLLFELKLITDNLSLPGVLAAQVPNFWSGQLHRGGAWMVQLCPSKYPPPIWHLVLGVQSQPALSFTMNHFLVKWGWRIMQENETPCSQTSNAFIACSTYCQLTSLWMRLQTCACETPCCLMSRDLKLDCSYNLSSRYSKKSNFWRWWGKLCNTFD